MQSVLQSLQARVEAVAGTGAVEAPPQMPRSHLGLTSAWKLMIELEEVGLKGNQSELTRNSRNLKGTQRELADIVEEKGMRERRKGASSGLLGVSNS